MTPTTWPIDVLNSLCAARDGCVLALRQVGCRGDAADAIKGAIDLLDGQIAAVVAEMGEGRG